MAGQESGSRPSSHVVPRVQVRSMIVVHSDGYKVLVDDLRDVGIGIRRFVHDMAPVAPNCRDGQQDGFVLCLCFGEGSIAPRQPVDLAGQV